MQEPNRYVRSALLTRLCREAVAQQASLTDLLAASTGAMHERTAERVERFLDTADALVGRLDAPAHKTVEWLLAALDYEQHLRRRSAFEELADQRIQTARSLIDFSRGHPDVRSVLAHINDLSGARPERTPDAEALEIRSIHRAKGREWPVVFVPGCNDGTIPASQRHQPARNRGGTPDDAPETGRAPRGPSTGRRAEERRLFYVALTRAKEALRLSYDRTEPPSPFLEEADAEHRLALCARVREGTARPAADWTAADVAWLCVGAGELRLRRFLETWWRPTDAQRRALRAHLRRPEALHEAAAAELRAYAQSGPAHRPSTETPRPDASPPDASRPDASRPDAKRDTGPTDTEPPTAPTTDTESSADAEQAASGGRDAAAARADGEPIDRARLRRLWNAFREGRRVVGAALSLDLPEGAVAPPEDVFGVLGGAPEE